MGYWIPYLTGQYFGNGYTPIDVRGNKATITEEAFEKNLLFEVMIVNVDDCNIPGFPKTYKEAQALFNPTNNENINNAELFIEQTMNLKNHMYYGDLNLEDILKFGLTKTFLNAINANELFNENVKEINSLAISFLMGILYLQISIFPKENLVMINPIVNRDVDSFIKAKIDLHLK